MTVTPRPIEVITCDLCYRPWDEHIRVAKAEAIQKFRAQLPEDSDVSTPEELLYVVESHHCVWVLLASQKGHMGTTGAVGAVGVTGATGKDGRNGTNGPVSANGPTGPSKPSWVDGSLFEGPMFTKFFGSAGPTSE